MIKKARNVEYLGTENIEQLNGDIPIYILTEQTAAEWNEKAKIKNTEMFKQIFKIEPKSYDEVLKWVFQDKKTPRLATR